MESLLLNPVFITIMLLLLVWELVWKAIALWHSARNNQLTWFVVIIILNTAGILPIIYFYFFRKDKSKSKSKPKK